MSAATILAHPNQLLIDHLSGVARRAEEFAAHFSAEEHAHLAGLLHDVGKAEPEFQKRLDFAAGRGNDDGEKQPHALHGAALALKHDQWPVAFAIAGHHAGLHNRHDLDSMHGRRGYYSQRATDWCCIRLAHSTGTTFQSDFGSVLPKYIESMSGDSDEQLLAVDLYTRFLFSALVDADRLDTEENDPEARDASMNRKAWSSFDARALLKLTTEFITAKRNVSETLAGRQRDVQVVRDEVGDLCKTAASLPRGLFSLAVPTGGGKTLASLLFALCHAHAHARDEADCDGIHRRPIRRIIVVIPYLSIIQQTAFELRKVFGDLVWAKDATDPQTGRKVKHPETGEEGAWVENNDPNHTRVVLEHHSGAADPLLVERKGGQAKDGDYSPARSLRQLAAENWDAPIVVTTSVQFFDSMFSRRPADARKLHNIAQSVIIFDEVQTLPPHLLQPILEVLGQLTSPDRPYGCSAVFCTATQPALSHDQEEFPHGLRNIRHIVPPETAERHFKTLKRVTYSGIQKDAEPETLTPDQVASQATAQEQKQCLIVVNTRNSARRLFASVQAKTMAMGLSDATFHLSTWMVPAHRLQVLEEVRRRLSVNEPCFLVSTQCIEAGVDVDFPEVWRAYGPYDSIVQAAGRCNREGKLKGLGNVRVFRLEGDDPEGRSGIYGTATAQTTLLRKMGRALPEDPSSFGEYFRLLYQISMPDECPIQEHRAALHFEEVSKLFRLIEDYSVPLLVLDQVIDGKPVSTPARAIHEAARMRRIPGEASHGWFTREDWRRIQPWIVALDSRSKTVQATLRPYTEPVFAPDDGLDLRIWQAGNAGYLGGLNGTGINFEDLSQTTAELITGLL
nr:CRISPR-associated endonuclease Cas3'' [uncultured Methanoregula sp.]